VAVTLREQGRLQQTIEICQREIQRADSTGLKRGSVVGALLAIWGEALAEVGDVERAMDLANQGVTLTERGVDLAMRGWSYLCFTRILFSAGDMVGAGAIVKVRCFSFPISGMSWRSPVRYLAGVIILLICFVLLRSVYPPRGTTGYYVIGFVHSALNGLWISLGAPWFFRVLKL
jgi:hypothetical protein